MEMARVAAAVLLLLCGDAAALPQRVGWRDAIARLATQRKEHTVSELLPQYRAALQSCALAAAWRPALALLDELRDGGATADARSF